LALVSIAELEKIGVKSLKIEGRMRPAAYVAETARLFKHKERYKNGNYHKGLFLGREGIICNKDQKHKLNISQKLNFGEEYDEFIEGLSKSVEFCNDEIILQKEKNAYKAKPHSLANFAFFSEY